MRRLWVIAMAVVASVLVGCDSIGAGAGCTEIGARTGVSVTVEPPLPTERTVLLTVCSTVDVCVDAVVELRPGGDVVDMGCTGTGPAAPCSVRATPNGTLFGFAAVELTDAPVTVSASFGSEPSDPPDFGPADFAPRTFHPNGPDCPGEGRSVAITMQGS